MDQPYPCESLPVMQWLPALQRLGVVPHERGFRSEHPTASATIASSEIADARSVKMWSFTS
jgi:hypothetical protein